MNDGLKQRIVGALVLVALGIIFIPVIFDKERIVPVDRTTQIPPEPDIVAIPLPEPPKAPGPKAPEIEQPINGEFKVDDAPVDIAETDNEPETSANAAEIENDAEPTPPKRSAPSIVRPTDGVNAWVLQIASYKDRKLAEALRDKLIEQGQQAFVKEVQTSAGARVRLYLGPTINKADLQKSKTTIDKKYGVDSIIYRYTP